MNNRTIGYAGEEIARNFLHAQGFILIASNFTVRGGEIDLVAEDHAAPEGKCLVFIEVKMRRNHAFGRGEDSVGFFKLKSMKRAARIYRKNFRRMDPFRFDVVTIDTDKTGRVNSIDHFKDIGAW